MAFFVIVFSFGLGIETSFMLGELLSARKKPYVSISSRSAYNFEFILPVKHACRAVGTLGTINAM